MTRHQMESERILESADTNRNCLMKSWYASRELPIYTSSRAAQLNKQKKIAKLFLNAFLYYFCTIARIEFILINSPIV